MGDATPDPLPGYTGDVDTVWCGWPGCDTSWPYRPADTGQYVDVVAHTHDHAGAFEWPPVDLPWPPLTGVDAMPMHPADHLRGVERWACTRFSADPLEVRYDWRCAECVKVARIIVDGGHDPVQSWAMIDPGRLYAARLSWLVVRSEHHGVI